MKVALFIAATFFLCSCQWAEKRVPGLKTSEDTEDDNRSHHEPSKDQENRSNNGGSHSPSPSPDISGVMKDATIQCQRDLMKEVQEMTCRLAKGDEVIDDTPYQSLWLLSGAADAYQAKGERTDLKAWPIRFLADVPKSLTPFIVTMTISKEKSGTSEEVKKSLDVTALLLGP